MLDEINYRLRGWLWLGRELLSHAGARLKARWNELEQRGRAETKRRYEVSQAERHAARVRRWAAARKAGEPPAYGVRRRENDQA